MKTTIVTGLWNLGRGNLQGWANRDFDYYKSRFFELLETDIPMCIWIPKDLESEVIKIRGSKPTHIFIKNVEDFKSWNPFFEDIQKIRNNSNWTNSAGWLSESPQAALEFYNAMMFTKMFMLNDSAVVNPFNSQNFFWIDGGISNTVDIGYFTKNNVFNNLSKYYSTHNKFTFIMYPYTSNEEIHGFERKKMAEYCRVGFVDYVARGGFFGGSKSDISKINAIYYELLRDTLQSGYMGADECLFTILCYRYPNLINIFKVEGNGLIWPFFEHLSTLNALEIKNKIALYILTFNSPNQVKHLLHSIQEYNSDLLYNIDLYLINNSTKDELDEEYQNICDTFRILHLKQKNNLGVCGGRQFAAEHSDAYDYDYHLFFEDDMFFHNNKNDKCKIGFSRYYKDILNKSVDIIKKENLDFIKLSFSEFFGDNSKQWAWFNVPQDIRNNIWENNTDTSIKENCPSTNLYYIDSLDELPYAVGEIYYSNWPQVVSKEGNRKMFLETTWQHPFEQTWMSYIFQKTREKYIKAGVLLLSPIEHNRFDHYPREDRREN